MCGSGATGHNSDVQAAAPREAPGPAVDPIALEPVDEVVVVTLMDNSFDALMGDVGPARRASYPRLPTTPAPQFAEGATTPGLVAEHGFSALVTVRRGAATHTLLFDTGVSPDGLATNAERLGVDVAAIEAVVLSHGALRPFRWLRRPGPPAWPRRVAADRAPPGLDEAPVRPAQPADLAASDAQPRIA
jgi:7,8-dihydropterin-6-yl-methyl-4-(beta-D-ribofuranosyl)aminobenzene 5'-phosphate synthase